jgi:predicted transcriptional regulator
MKKTTVLNALNELPKEFSLDDFLERLLVIEKIDEGLQDVKENKITPHEKVKKLVTKWQK